MFRKVSRLLLVLPQVVPIAPHLVYSGINAPNDLGETAAPEAGPADEFVSLADNEARYIRQVLRHTDGMIAGKGGAADVLGKPFAPEALTAVSSASSAPTDPVLRRISVAAVPR